MDDIDWALTNILVRVDRKCWKLNTYPWSLALHKAYLIHQCWKLKQSALFTKRDYDKMYQRIRTVVGDKVLLQAPMETIHVKIRQARNNLQAIQCKASNKQKQFLNDLAAAAKHTKNKNQQKLIFGLKQAEENQWCFAMVHQILQPRTGGLTHILTATKTNGQWETINNQATMEMLLLQQSQNHFKQADGTLYMAEPLCSLH